MEQKEEQSLVECNQQCRCMSLLYHKVAAAFGMCDSTLWIFYALLKSGGKVTQQELCEHWSFTKQTLNSAICSMIQKGYIEQEQIAGTRNKKVIRITQKGNEVAKDTVEVLLEVELRVTNDICKEVKQQEEGMKAIYERLKEELEHTILRGEEPVDNPCD